MSTVTYYFNDYAANVETWTCYSGNMTNGSIDFSGDEGLGEKNTDNRAMTNNWLYYMEGNPEGDYDTHLLTENTCTGTDLGIISKVELRAFGHGQCMTNHPGNSCVDWAYSGNSNGDNKVNVNLRPVFNGDTDANTVGDLDLSQRPSYTSWFDITDDSNAPSPWTWSDIVNLDCDVYSTKAKAKLYGLNYYWSSCRIFQVDIRVTYDETYPESPYNKDLLIFYDDLSVPNFIDCWCSRWDVQNYNVVMETWLKKSDLQTLRENITPQAVGELYTILGRPRYYDSTWTGDNTIKLVPTSDNQIAKMRGEKLIYVKNISDSPVKGPSGWLNVKIEGMISGTGAL